MKQNKFASGPSTRRAKAQRLEHRLSTKAEGLNETPERTPTGIINKITRNQAWIGRYATGEHYGQSISGNLIGLTEKPTLEIAPTESIVRAFDFLGSKEARRRLDIITHKNKEPLPYEVGEFILRQDEWSILLLAVPSVITAENIRREQEAVRSRLDARPAEEHQELVIGSFNDMPTAEVFQATLTAQNDAASEPMLMFGASKVRGL